MNPEWPIWLKTLADAWWSGLMALGFAIMFNVPKRVMLACVVCAAIGHATRFWLVQTGWGLEVSTLIAATLVGFMGRWCAQKFSTPSLVFHLTGSIPMVPGVFAFRTMLGMLNLATAKPGANEAILAATSTNAVKTALILCALAIGIAVPSLLFRHPKPVV